MLSRKWKRWLHGVVVAVSAGMTAPVTAFVFDPVAFSPREHVGKFLGAWAVSALMSLFLYFKQSPPPIFDDEEIAPRSWKEGNK